MEKLSRTPKLVLQIVMWSIFLIFAVLKMIPRDYDIVTAACVCTFLTFIQSATISIVVKWGSAKSAFIKIFAILLVVIELIALFLVFQFFSGLAFNDINVATWLRISVIIPPMLNFFVFVAFLNYGTADEVTLETNEALR